MISKKAQIDQTLASIVVFIVLIFIMALFIQLSSNIGNVIGFSNEPERAQLYEPQTETINSQLLLELFLSDQIFDGTATTSVKEAIERMGQTENEFLAQRIVTHFNDEYSCDNTTVLLIDRPESETVQHSQAGSVVTDRRFVYINYPEKTTPVLEITTSRYVHGFDGLGQLSGEYYSLELPINPEKTVTITMKGAITC